MDLGCVLENECMVSNCALSQPNLSDSRGRIGKQAGLIVGVYPGPRHDFGAIPRPDLMFESIDQGIQRSLINESLLNQQRLKSLGTQRRVGRNDLVVVVVRLVGVGGIGGYRCSCSCNRGSQEIATGRGHRSNQPHCAKTPDVGSEYAPEWPASCRKCWALSTA